MGEQRTFWLQMGNAIKMDEKRSKDIGRWIQKATKSKDLEIGRPAKGLKEMLALWKKTGKHSVLRVYDSLLFDLKLSKTEREFRKRLKARSGEIVEVTSKYVKDYNEFIKNPPRRKPEGSGRKRKITYGRTAQRKKSNGKTIAPRRQIRRHAA